MTNRFPPKEYQPSDDVVLKVQGLCSPLPKSFQGVSFELKRGEILGIGGLVGAQRTELVEAIFGLRAVSYTHLDVYKRQHYTNPIRNMFHYRKIMCYEKHRKSSHLL